MTNAILMLATLSGFLDRWAPAADWAVALGTAGLAVATVILAHRAHEEASKVGEQVNLERQQMELATHPVVYPACTFDFARRTQGTIYASEPGMVLPLRNGGPGLALNVHGACYHSNPGGRRRISVEILGGTIADYREVDRSIALARIGA